MYNVGSGVVGMYEQLFITLVNSISKAFILQRVSWSRLNIQNSLSVHNADNSDTEKEPRWKNLHFSNEIHYDDIRALKQEGNGTHCSHFSFVCDITIT
jgi:hypothetical protein